MKPTDRARLTTALRDHVSRAAADLRAKIRADGPERVRALHLHTDEQVGEDFEVWTDLLSRRAAVLWVLKSVYVRVLEDKGQLSPGRILDAEAQQLFEKLAPNLGETAFLRWVYRDLASPRGGLPELFAPQPAEVAEPADKLSRELLAFWRHRDPDLGTHWSFAEERFEGELMGDLYQELDPVVKARFALCQTPDFVRSFILDRTLTPAIETYGAETVRLLDPACGSGHFLIDGLKRLVEATGKQHPDWERRKLVVHCLNRVVGIDLNDYACALARARLVMTAAEMVGVNTLDETAQFHPHVYWADALEQVEKGTDSRGQQLSLFDPPSVEAPRASLTRPEVRATLSRVLKQKFHVVVANPPYISEHDEANKIYHRERQSGHQRYVAAYREYTLAAVFVERAFQTLLAQGYLGTIVENGFMKWPRGIPLIEAVLPQKDLYLVVDTSQAFIPHHGTATVILFARNQSPSSESVRAILGKRGESVIPMDPSEGRVWSSIVSGAVTLGFENEYVSSVEVSRQRLTKHPWTLRGGGAADLRELLEHGRSNLGQRSSIGLGIISGADSAFIYDPRVLERQRLSHYRPLVTGEVIRDWRAQAGEVLIWPHTQSGELLDQTQVTDVIRFLWPYRTTLRQRRVFGRPLESRGLPWWAVKEVYRDKLRSAQSLVIAGIATHNQAAFDQEGAVFNNRSAPVIKLPTGATEDDHLEILGLLNSSSACFWMKQVFHCKGSQGVNEGMKSALWEQFFEFDSTKLRLFPIAENEQAVNPYARALDAVARQRSTRSVAAILDDADAWTDARALRETLDARREADLDDLYRMVALQEELDWLCYRLYGLDDALPIVTPNEIEPCPPTWLPWVLDLAERDAEIRAALEQDEDPGEIPTAWFERHRWQPLTALPDASPPVQEGGSDRDPQPTRGPRAETDPPRTRDRLPPGMESIAPGQGDAHPQAWSQLAPTTETITPIDGDNRPFQRSHLPPSMQTIGPGHSDNSTRSGSQLASGTGSDDPAEVARPPGEAPSPQLRARIEQRRQRIREVPALSLIETAAYKRRWYKPDYEAEEKEALQAWLADRVEEVARERGRPFTIEQMAAAVQDDARFLAVAEVLTGRRTFKLTQLVQELVQADAVPQHRFHVYKESGLDKRAAWEQTWEAQRREDAGEKVTPEVPPSYTQADFLKPEYFRLRGKLDVPKERFIALTEVPGREGDTLYGWAGWTPLQRLKALLAIDEDLDDAGVPLADRAGLLDSAWRLLPDVQREDAPAAGRLKAELQALVGGEGPSRELIADWTTRFPPPGTKAGRKARKSP